jgi:addiction module RelB/DinJ family antitoxin
MFKTDKKLKEASQKMAKKMGIPFSAVMNQVLREIVNREQIIFSAQEYEPTPYLKRLLIQGEKDLKTGKNIKHYNSLEELRAELDA